MGVLTKIAVAGFLASAAAPAFAVAIPNGTLSLVSLTTPSVTLGGSPTVSFAGGTTFQISGSGGFATAAPSIAGTLNGTLNFSATTGTTVAQSGVGSFFTFTDPTSGDSFSFTPLSALTSTYSISPGTSSISLFLLGTTVDTLLGYDATPTSLTLSFNSTNASAYSAAATLAIPPAVVPEPATWAMMVAGFGLVGAAARRRRTVVSAVRFG